MSGNLNEKKNWNSALKNKNMHVVSCIRRQSYSSVFVWLCFLCNWFVCCIIIYVGVRTIIKGNKSMLMWWLEIAWYKKRSIGMRKRERKIKRGFKFLIEHDFVSRNWGVDVLAGHGRLSFRLFFRFWSRRWLSGVCAWASPRSRPASDLLPDRMVVDRIARLWQLSNNGVQRWCRRLRQLSKDVVQRRCRRPGSVAGVCTKASINRKVHRSPGVNIHCTFLQCGGADHRTDAIH